MGSVDKSEAEVMIDQRIETHALKCVPVLHDLSTKLDNALIELRAATMQLQSTNERIAALSQSSVLVDAKVHDLHATMFGKDGVKDTVVRMQSGQRTLNVVVVALAPMAVSGLVALVFMLGQLVERTKSADRQQIVQQEAKR